MNCIDSNCHSFFFFFLFMSIFSLPLFPIVNSIDHQRLIWDMVFLGDFSFNFSVVVVEIGHRIFPFYIYRMSKNHLHHSFLCCLILSHQAIRKLFFYFIMSSFFLLLSSSHRIKGLIIKCYYTHSTNADHSDLMNASIQLLNYYHSLFMIFIYFFIRKICMLGLLLHLAFIFKTN